MKFLRKKLPDPMLKTLKNVVSNRYFWVTAVAFFYMLFFDTFDLRSQWKMKSRIEQLESQREEYIASIAELQEEYQKLENDPSELEKLAREQYLMKRNNEDLFIIVPESEK